MERAKVFRGFRIVWTAIFGLACVLLVVIWVWSYRAETRLSGHYSGSIGFRIYSSRGCIVCYAPNLPFQPNSYPWLLERSPHWLQESDPRIAPVPRLHYHSQEMWATFPYWFLLGLFGLLATAPWIMKPFSLRTLLVATTVIAVVLAFVVYR